jgi:hypothetical protein
MMTRENPFAGRAKARKTWIPENCWRIREKKNRLDKKRNRKVF